MLIEKIELRHIKMELISPFETSSDKIRNVEHIIIRIDSGGITGWGECVVEPSPLYSYETLQTAWHILDDFIIPSILKKEIWSIRDALHKYNWIRGHNMAKAGVEAALSDAFAKSKGISLSAFLGGTRKIIPVGVSVGLQPSLPELIKVVAGYLNDGYKRIKIKIAPGRDIELVKALRKEYPDILLQADANSAYTLEDIEILRALDDYNLQLIEQPLGYDDIHDHSLLQSRIKTPICLDESIRNISDTKAAILLGSCKIINIKPGRVGGYTEAIKIHNYCMSGNIPVWHGGMYESGIGRAGNIALASLPYFNLPADISAGKRYFKKDIVEPGFVINKDSTMDVPVKPGIGVNIDLEALDTVTIRKAIY